MFCGGGFEGHAVGEERAGSVCEGGAEGFHFLFLWVCFPSIFFFCCLAVVDGLGWIGFLMVFGCWGWFIWCLDCVDVL